VRALRHPSAQDFAVGLSILLFAASSLASEQGAAEDTRRVFWTESEVVLKVDSTFLGLPYAEEALTGAIAAWQSAVPAFPRVMVEYPNTATPMTGDEPGNTLRVAYDYEPRLQQALAITLISRDSASGRIFDADIVVSPLYRFTDVLVDAGEGSNCPGGSEQGHSDRYPGDRSAWDAKTPVYDLQNVITHELGHWFGLDEAFEDQDATMYAYVDPGETLKRDPTAGDILVATDLYDQVAHTQTPDGIGCGAQIAGRGPVSGSRGWLLTVLVLAGLTVSRRWLVLQRQVR
jgi:hypothetical protein